MRQQRCRSGCGARRRCAAVQVPHRTPRAFTRSKHHRRHRRGGPYRAQAFCACAASPPATRSPVPDVIVTISQRSGTGIPDKTVTTGPEALSDDVAIACPPRSYSLDENNRTVLPYAVVDVTAEHEGYDPCMWRVCRYSTVR